MQQRLATLPHGDAGQQACMPENDLLRGILQELATAPSVPQLSPLLCTVAAPVVQALQECPGIPVASHAQLIRYAFEALLPPRQLSSACRRDIYIVLAGLVTSLRAAGALEAPGTGVPPVDLAFQPSELVHNVFLDVRNGSPTEQSGALSLVSILLHHGGQEAPSSVSWSTHLNHVWLAQAGLAPPPTAPSHCACMPCRAVRAPLCGPHLSHFTCAPLSSFTPSFPRESHLRRRA